MRRMSFRNMRYLYERTCDATGKKIFTLIPPDAPMPVYDYEYWESDAWDPMDYGMEYDFSKPFFEQIRDLFNKVPWAPMWSMEKTNSDYSIAAWAKNCYLCFDAGYLEDSAYSVTLLRSKQCIDMVNCKGCELCYYCINTNDSYKTFFSRSCTSCNDVWFSQDCVGCDSCFGCSGLRNKSYHIFNESYGKEEYQKKLAEMRLDSWSGIERARGQAMEVWLKHPVKYQHSVQAKNCTGDYLYNATELRNCFFVGTAQNMAHCQSVIYGPNKDGMDVTSSEGTELTYDIIATGHGIYNTFFTAESFAANESRYTVNCRQSNNLFGCVALKSKQYCILNRQYSKEDYRAMVPKIIKHMNKMPYVDAKGRVYKYGEFFPPDMSAFGYSETQAHEYFPLTEKEAKAQGYNWRRPKERAYSITKTSDELPDQIQKLGDDILKEVIQCQHDENNNHPEQCGENCATAFRITFQELQFYRQLNLPLPRLCFNCRHFDRVAWRNRPQLFHRQCVCDYKVYKNTTKHNHHLEGRCPNEFETSYAPDREEIVYCEQCYQAEVV